jgi:Protein of unknown function (DUF3108)
MAAGASAEMPETGDRSPLGSLKEQARGRGWLGSARADRARALRLAVGALLLALVAGHAAAGSDEPLELRYRFSWAGMPIAELGIRHVTNGTIYQTELAVQTIGLTDRLVHFRALSRATGQFTPADGFIASRFRSASSSYTNSRRILVRFDPRTGDVIELELTKHGEPDRGKVPAALQKGVIDPLTALVQARHRLAAGDFTDYTAAVFDGRRRYDVRARVTGRARVQIAGRVWPVIELEVDLAMIAGANQDDLDQAEAGDNLLRVKVLLSDDRRLIPLQLSTIDSLFTAMAEIMPECLGAGGCPPVSG